MGAPVARRRTSNAIVGATRSSAFSGTLVRDGSSVYLKNTFPGANFDDMPKVHLPAALAHLSSLMDDIAGSVSPKTACDFALVCLQRGLHVERAAVLLFDTDGVMRFVAWRGLSEEYRRAVEGHSPWDSRQRNPTPILVGDARQADHLASYRNVFEREHIAALAFIPLSFAGTLLGKFMLYYDAPHSFSDEEVAIARAIAGHVGFAVAHLRTAEQLLASRAELDARFRSAVEARERAERSKGHLVRLQQSAEALARAITPSDVFDILGETGSSAVGAQAAMVFLVSRDNGCLELVHAHGYDAGRAEVFARVDLQASLPVTDAYRDPAGIFIESPEDFSRRYPDVANESRVTKSIAFACCPICASSGCLGVVIFSFATRRSFDEDERTFMLSLTNQAAIAIDRAKFYEEIQRTLRAREDLLAIVSHDLRVPLSIVSMKATLMRDALPDAADGPNKRDAELILRNAARMDRLIRDLLDFSRIEAGELRVTPEVVPLFDVLRQTLETVQPLLETRRIELRCSAEASACRVHGDRERLLQIIDNLLSNAIKFTGGDGRIAVAVEVREKDVVISIEDTGSGIAAEDLPRVFNRYWQGGSQRPGLGLGLHITKALVEAHGGQIWAQSALGRGTTVSFSVPLA